MSASPSFKTEEPAAIMVDNLAGSFTGTWSTSTAVGGYYGANYQAQAAGSGANSFTWTPSIPTTGSYKVYARWIQHPNRSTQATYTVNHATHVERQDTFVHARKAALVLTNELGGKAGFTIPGYCNLHFTKFTGDGLR